MIVAHPDDESLFGGEALLGDGGWTVVCVTNASNPVRRSEFELAMESVGANYTLLDHEDTLKDGDFDPRLADTLAGLLAEFSYRRVVTHNRRGEYGHPQHRALHRIVRGLARRIPLYVFAPGRRGPGMSAAKRRLLEHYRSQESIEGFYRLGEHEAFRPNRRVIGWG